MSPRIPSAVLRAAGRQAWITLRRKYTSWTGLSMLIWPPVLLVILWFFRDTQFRDVVGASSFLFAGFLAFGIIAGAVLGVDGEIHTEREDGTLLRAKAVSGGRRWNESRRVRETRIRCTSHHGGFMTDVSARGAFLPSFS